MIDGPAYVPYPVFLEWSDRFRKEITEHIDDNKKETLRAINDVGRSVERADTVAQLNARDKRTLRVAVMCSAISAITTLVTVFIHV